MLIASKLIVNKSKQGAKLLIENPISSLVKPFWQSAGKPKVQKKPRKKSCIKNKAEHDSSIEAEALGKSGIKTENSYNHLV